MGCCCGCCCLDTVAEEERQPLNRPPRPQVALNDAVVVCRPPAAVLEMYLDANRDGNVDVQPANYGNWVWGANTNGGVLMVMPDPPTLMGQQPSVNVPERAELVFRWRNDLAEQANGWTAVLTVDQPARIRFFATRARADNVPLVLNAGRLDIAAQQAGNDGAIHLWMTAADYGADANEASWRVMLTFDYTPPQGQVVRQRAQLRIAPWIMAADTDPTHTVLGVGRMQAADIDVHVAATAQNSGAAFGRRPVSANMAGNMLKPFLRDPIKCGYGQGPQHSGVVILRTLDDPERCYYTTLFNIANTANIERPANLDPTSQDNGGNLMVSPPVANYPLGRIIYGHSQNKPCTLAAFFASQRMQTPIVVDSTWLRVGHSDEIVSFLPNIAGAAQDAWPWRMLLMSPTLGYALAFGAAAQHQPNNVDTLITDAMALSASARQHNWDYQTLGARCAQQFGQTQAAQGAGANASAIVLNAPNNNAYVQNPAVPGNAGDHDGKLIVPDLAGNLTAHHLHHHLQQAPHQAAFDATRGPLAQARQTLQQQLGNVGDDHVIEIPVLLNMPVQGEYGTSTADAVNLLYVRGGIGSHALIPKPFGPVAGNTWLFERHISTALAPLGVTIVFANDWDWYHRHEGEIHCGTNQVPALPPPATWWHQAPP